MRVAWFPSSMLYGVLLLIGTEFGLPCFETPALDFFARVIGIAYDMMRYYPGEVVC